MSSDAEAMYHEFFGPRSSFVPIFDLEAQGEEIVDAEGDFVAKADSELMARFLVTVANEWAEEYL